MSQPIDYARGESTDVVRKKFRRRVVWFVIATVAVMVIGCGWVHSSRGGSWWIGNSFEYAISGGSGDGWIVLNGPLRTGPPNRPGTSDRTVGNYESGVVFQQVDWIGSPKWQLQIRYRTLFILAMIPWIITLIRLIRIWKKRKVLSPEC